MESAWLSVAQSSVWKYRLKLMADWRYRLAAPLTPDTFISRYFRPGRVSKSRAVLRGSGSHHQPELPETQSRGGGHTDLYESSSRSRIMARLVMEM